MTRNLYHFYVACFISSLFLIIFFILSSLGLIQSAESTSLIGEASRWCERVSDGIFREPINTLSNLGFMVVGLYIFWILCNDDKNSNFQTWPFNQRFHLLLNIAVGGDWPGSPDQTTIFPTEMEIDYVRVYEEIKL